MVLRIFKMIATSGFATALECTEFVFGRTSAWTAHPDPLAGLRGWPRNPYGLLLIYRPRMDGRLSWRGIGWRGAFGSTLGRGRRCAVVTVVGSERDRRQLPRWQPPHLRRRSYSSRSVGGPLALWPAPPSDGRLSLPPAQLCTGNASRALGTSHAPEHKMQKLEWHKTKERKVDLYCIAPIVSNSTTKRPDVDHTELPANTPHLPFLRISIR